MEQDVVDEVRLARARANRWWVTGRRRVASIRRAGEFVQDVGFALLFPAPRIALPSLWDAVAGDAAEPFADGMGRNEQRVWAWKDELPRLRVAWYGRFVAGRGSFLSPALLAALYPGDGTITDHEDLELSPTAHRIAELLAGGPLTSAELRVEVGNRRSYERAVGELQRHLLVTGAGVHDSGRGWPATLLDLSCRRFDVGHGPDHGLAAQHFADTMVRASVQDLARAFGWSRAEAASHLGRLDRPPD
ncbi:MAG: hypothetical protein GEU96_09170 [Propionibacteriales bacterium]|nr:hypothetical protein [Propionibacteriales bacterium]